jgi:uncharacterized protein YbjT (DUF2867 family)
MASDTDGPTLIIGGTGGTGAEVSRILLARGAPVRLLARDPARADNAASRGAEIVVGNVTEPKTVMASMKDVRVVVYTAGIRTFFAEARGRAVVVDGVRNALEAARFYGNVRRFVFMSSIGVACPSAFGLVLELVKGGALRQKAEAEKLVRASEIPYSIVRAGVLTDSAKPGRPVVLSQNELPLRPDLLIGRVDAARTLVRSVTELRACNATFDAVWGKPGDPNFDFESLSSDRAS